MNHLRFLDRSSDLGPALPGTYDLALVPLSFVVASLAAYAALGVAGRMGAAETPIARRSWLTAGAASMGLGVWAMHFIGMLALRLPISVNYDIFVTLLSMAPAILASGVVLLVICRTKIEIPELMLGGILMGAGIGAMHYTGMAAMRMNAEMFYDPVLFGASILVAVVLATLALYTNLLARRRDPRSHLHWTTLSASLVMGMAVVGMHFTGMASAHFFPAPGSAVFGEALDPTLLALWVGFATIPILGLAILLTVIDVRLKAAAHSERTSRSRMIQAIDSMSDGFCMLDMDQRLVLCNDRFREFFPGLDPEPGTPLEAVLRHTAERGLLADTGGNVERWVADRVAATRRSGGEVLQLADGRWLQVSWSQTEGHETPVLFTDVTELKRAHDAAEAANRAKSQFLSNMSHELRTPLNGVLGYAQILQRDQTLSSDQRFSLKAIESCGEHLLALINDVLDLSKIESGRLDVDNTPSDFPHLLRSVCDIVRPRADAKELRFSLEVSPRIPKGIVTDAPKLRQVLVNLLGNAVKFTEEGAVVLSVTESAPGRLQLAVKDTGMGIPPQKLAEIFDPFKQVDGVRATEGTGLGLAISRRLVEAMGGTVAVESEPGRGSCFTISLPLVEVGDGELLESVEEPKTDAGHCELAPGQDVAVLIADDRDTNRDILVRLLQGAGFRTAEAVNGADAIEKMRAQHFPLVLMDVRMPVMNGLEATRIIRDDPRLKGTVVIVISATVFPEAQQQIIEAGADDFIGKPLRASEVFTKIERHLKVTFIEPDEQTELAAVGEGAALPSELATAVAQRLRDAVEVGDVTEVHAVASELSAHPDAGSRYSDEIVRLAKAFDFEGLLHLANTVEHAATS